MDKLATKHIRCNKLLYFFPREKIVLTVVCIFVCLLSLILLSFKAFSELIILLFVLLVPVFFLGVLPAYKRARFLSRGDSYRIFDGFLESQSLVLNERFSFKGKNVKCIQRRNGIVDIVIGEGFQDFLKFFGSSEKSKITICGVLNGDEVLEYLRSHT